MSASMSSSSRDSSTSAPRPSRLLAIAVIIIGLVAGPSGRAEALAVLGFFGYGLYLSSAAVVLYVMARRS